MKRFSVGWLLIFFRVKYVSQKFALLKLQLFLKLHLHAVSSSWTTTMLKSVGVEEKGKTHLLLVVLSLSFTEFVVSLTESRVYPRSSYFNNNYLFLLSSFDFQG